MPLFRREPPPAAPTPVEDVPAELRTAVRGLVGFVNSHAGRLPVDSVVAALGVTDTITEIIDIGDERALDVHAIVAVKGIVTDYLPTTLRSYISLDPSVTDVVRPSGRTPKASLLEQVESLWSAATEVLTATRARDADALLSQGSFLATKFSRSDLDL